MLTLVASRDQHQRHLTMEPQLPPLPANSLLVIEQHLEESKWDPTTIAAAESLRRNKDRHNRLMPGPPPSPRRGMNETARVSAEHAEWLTAPWPEINVAHRLGISHWTDGRDGLSNRGCHAELLTRTSLVHAIVELPPRYDRVPLSPTSGPEHMVSSYRETECF